MCVYIYIHPSICISKRERERERDAAMFQFDDCGMTCVWTLNCVWLKSWFISVCLVNWPVWCFASYCFSWCLWISVVRACVRACMLVGVCVHARTRVCVCVCVCVCVRRACARVFRLHRAFTICTWVDKKKKYIYIYIEREREREREIDR